MTERQRGAEGEEAEDADFELPLSAEQEAEPQLRRGLFGIRRADVRAEISSRDQAIAELRRDVTALWLAFGQHERTIRELTGALKGLSGVEIEPPGGRRAERPEPYGDPPPYVGYQTAQAQRESVSTSGATPRADEIGEQLSGLDDVLAAIQRATASLEQAYNDEIEPGDDQLEDSEETD